MFIKKLIRKQLKRIVSEELGKASVTVVAKNIKIRIKYDNEIYEAKLSITNDTVEVGNFIKV